MAGKTAILTLRILADAKDAQKGLDETATSADKLQSGVGKAAVPAAAALAGLAAAGISAAKAAAEDEASANQLALALRNSAGASDKSIANTEAWITKTSKAAAVADDELRPALGTLVRATGDVGEAQDLMGTALDVSAATGKDVSSVSDALAKAYAGQTTSLGKLVPGMDKAVLASGDMEAIQAELARTTGGAAAEAAGSAEGQWKGFQIALGEAQETIGGALLPAMAGLGGALAGVADWVGKNTTLFLVIGGVIGILAGTIIALNVAFKAYAVVARAVAAVQKIQETALIGTRIQLALLTVQQKIASAATKAYAVVQWILNAAMSANPVVLIVLAIIALIAVIVLIATKTTWFQDIWEAVWTFVVGIATAAWEGIVAGATAAIGWLVGIWEGLKAAVGAVWDWIVNAIEVVLAVIVAIVKAYIGVYVAIWEALKAGVAAVWDWIVGAVKAALGFVVDAVKWYIGLYISAFEKIKDGVGAVWDWLKDTASKALDAILKPIDAVRSAFDRVVDAIRSVIDWLGKIKIPDVVANIGSTIGNILGRSAAAPAGGVQATSPTARGFAAPSLSGSSAGSRAGVVININGALDPVSVARQLRAILTSDERRRAGVVIA